MSRPHASSATAHDDRPRIRNGQPWHDTAGRVIQAHGGGILVDGGRYYWYGENKNGPTVPNGFNRSFRVDVIGVQCYESDDLVHWQDRVPVLPAVPDDPTHDLHPSKVLERPKVHRCPATGQYVMWMHMETYRRDLNAVGVAVADSPLGPFTYRGSFRPHGCDSRDMTVFQDRDGSAWLVYAGERNDTLHVGRLSDDYLALSGDYARILAGRRREAPALFRHGEQLYLITSGCTGWWANPSKLDVARHPIGPWTCQGDPFADDAGANSHQSQGTYVLPCPSGDPDAFLYLADRWVPDDLGASTYVWLPFRVEQGRPVIRWQENWIMPSPSSATPGA